MAVNMDERIPMIRVTAKPLMMELPNHIRIAQVMRDEKFESRMDVHARLKPSSTAVDKSLPAFYSFFMLSKIKKIALTAMPTESINPAMAASVSVTGMSLKRTSTMLA